MTGRRTTDGGRALGFLPTGIARLVAELTLPVGPELAARVREAALSPPDGPEAQMALIATVAELRAAAEAATLAGAPGDRVLWRAAGSLGLLLDDDAEAVTTLERAAELLAAEPPDGARPTAEDRAVAAWCLATVAVAHHTRGRASAATATVRRARARIEADLAAEVLPPEEAVRIGTVLAFGAADPTRARGAVRRLERDAVRLLGVGASQAVEVRDLHGELMGLAGEHRAAVRHYRALADDLTAARGAGDRLTLQARSSLLFARWRTGEDVRVIAREYRAMVEAVEAAVAAASEAAGDGSDGDDEGAGGSPPSPADMRMLRQNLVTLLVEAGDHVAARPRVEAELAELRVELAGEGTADASVPLVREAGGRGLRVVDRLMLYLELRYQLLAGSIDRGDSEALADGADTALELHGLCERYGEVATVNRNVALRVALSALTRAGRGEEAAEVLRRALDDRAERYGDGSEPHVAAMALGADLVRRRGDPEGASRMATVALAVVDASDDPEAERHRRLLELLRDRRPVSREDLDL